ncbi:MAG: hypothetical protein FGM46_07295, partial [Ferruginibacter sp.]|nr:hypothetical protein [Ferruginibacter sp.]
HLYIEESRLMGEVNLSANEKSGLEIKNLTSTLNFTPNIMEFKNLDLTTNKSHITNYFSMQFDSFLDDMNAFNSKVRLKGRFLKSQINSDDIAIFAPELKDLKRKFDLSGDVSGTIENLSANDLKIKSGDTYFAGNVVFKGLPEIQSAEMNFNVNQLNSNYNELLTVAPSIKNNQNLKVSEIGSFNFSGLFKGQYNFFNLSGNLQTAAGNLSVDGKMDIRSKDNPTYETIFSFTDFNFGKLLGDQPVGTGSLSGKIRGKGFESKNFSANISTNISNIQIQDHNYKKIISDININSDLISGQMTVNDPDVKINHLQGEVKINSETPSYKIKADIDFLNLKKAGVTNKNLSLSGNIDLDLIGKKVEDLTGTATAHNLLVKSDNKEFFLPTLKIQSFENIKERILELQTDELDLSINGQFRLNRIRDAFIVVLQRYYPAYIKKLNAQTGNELFNFNIQTKNISPLLNLISPQLSGFDNSSISGLVDLPNNQLVLQGEIPSFKINEKTFTDFKLNSKGNIDSLHTEISIGEIFITDKFRLPETRLNISSFNNLSNIQIKTSGSETLNDAELNAMLKSYPDGFELRFSPSTFIVNENKWTLEKDGELIVRNNSVNARDIIFSHINQYVKIQTLGSDTGSAISNIRADIKNIPIQDFLPYLIKNPNLKGSLSGTLDMNNPLKNMTAAFNGKADSLLIEDKYIGDVGLESKLNDDEGKITYKAKTENSQNDFDLNGTYHYNDTSLNQINAILGAKKLNLSILEPYLGGVFSNIEGDVTSSIVVSGNKHHQYVNGNALIKSGFATVNYTNCKYVFDKQQIHFGNDVIDFGKMRITDTLKNSASVSGSISHQFFENIFFDNINIESEKISLLNTRKTNNDVFYGNAIGRAKLKINGPLDNIKMDLDLEPSIIDSSHIFLSTSEKKESNELDYIEFKKYGAEIEKNSETKSSNISVDMNIKTNPACKIDVILDEETGDIVKGKGNGIFRISVGVNDPLRIRGNYEITQGEYTFNFQTFLSKKFSINKGNITWNGDPYQANIDVEAEYLAKNVDLSSLSSDGGVRQREDIKIISRLTGILQNPVIRFSFELPEKSEARRNDLIVKKLADYKNDENEMNKQVASLLLFNTFINSNQNFLSQGNASTLISNTIGGMVSNLLTSVLNRELEKATNGILSTYIDINPTLNLQSSASQIQANVRAGLKILLSKRLVVLVGGNLDYNNSP